MDINIDRKEVRRYLGYGKNEADEKTNEVIETCIAELQAVASPKFTYEIFPLELLNNNRIDFGCFQVTSKNLSKNLQECHKIILFAATLGIQPDLLIAKYSLFEVSKAVIMQAAAAAMIEEVCDVCQEKIRQSMEEEGLYLRPRFSPGYGDFSIEHQPDMIRVLNCPKKIGLTVTDSLILAPAKSVTAVIGLSTKDQFCHRQGCEVCEKINCAFRRE